MTRTSASAPGKIVLCGEYAVLGGAPAIVTAVDRRARVVLETIGGKEHLLDAPGMASGGSQFRRLASGAYTWSGPRYPLVEHVLDACPAAAAASLSMQLDTQAFRDPQSGAKLGLGSSAALATALAAALDALFPGGPDVHQMAAAAHRNYQSGNGSGADVAASFAGGTIRFQRSDTGPGRLPGVRALPWPKGLEYRVLWSGQASDTVAKLRQLEVRKALRCNSAQALTASANLVADLWGSSSNETLLDALRTYVADLQHFSADQDLGIFDAGHLGLTIAAVESALVYKPCGAGGGDTGIVFGTSADALNTFCEHATRSGFTRLDLSIAAPGVSIEAGHDE
ncbi:MAG: hypothetical protein L0Y45_01040 [Woeseiaceae bacterium]|nr:hypothetical protein [Woeseiaceae bacterium]